MEQRFKQVDNLLLEYGEEVTLALKNILSKYRRSPIKKSTTKHMPDRHHSAKTQIVSLFANGQNPANNEIVSHIRKNTFDDPLMKRFDSEESEKSETSPRTLRTPNPRRIQCRSPSKFIPKEMIIQLEENKNLKEKDILAAESSFDLTPLTDNSDIGIKSNPKQKIELLKKILNSRNLKIQTQINSLNKLKSSTDESPALLKVLQKFEKQQNSRVQEISLNSPASKFISQSPSESYPESIQSPTLTCKNASPPTPVDQRISIPVISEISSPSNKADCEMIDLSKLIKGRTQIHRQMPITRQGSQKRLSLYRDNGLDLGNSKCFSPKTGFVFCEIFLICSSQ